MSNPHIGLMLEMMTALAGCTLSPDPECAILRRAGWVPLGKNAITGLEGWGKMIDGKAVTVDQPEALAIERGRK